MKEGQNKLMGGQNKLNNKYDRANEPSCCKKLQKKFQPRNWFGEMGTSEPSLKVLNDTKLVLNEHEVPP